MTIYLGFSFAVVGEKPFVLHVIFVFPMIFIGIFLFVLVWKSKG